MVFFYTCTTQTQKYNVLILCSTFTAWLSVMIVFSKIKFLTLSKKIINNLLEEIEFVAWLRNDLLTTKWLYVYRGEFPN